MTICIVTDSFPPKVGGIASFYKHLAELFMQNGHSVIVLTADPSHNTEDEIRFGSGPAVVVLKKTYAGFYQQYKPYFRPGGHDAPHWIAMGFAIRNWLLKYSSKFSIDILEVSDYGGLGAFLTGDGIPPFVITAHSSLHQLLTYNNFSTTSHIEVLKSLEALAFSRAQAIVAHSPLNQQAIEQLFHRKAEFSRAPWICVKQKKQLHTGAHGLTIGGLQNVKGAVFMAQVLSYLRQKNKSVSLEWIGYNTFTSPARSSMSEYLQKKFPEIWQKYFLWIGEKPHHIAMKTLEKALFIVIPSLWETFNYTALEAAAASKAIIITRTTGASYLFTHMQDAIIVDANNVKAMADAITLLQTNAELRERLGANAKKVIEQNFDEKQVMGERMLIYEKVLAQQKPVINVEADLSFLKKYTTGSREKYYKVRAALKKIIKSPTQLV